MTESTLTHLLLLEASKLGVTLFRNQVGRYQLMDGRWLTSGLAVGSPDLVGWQSVTIGPEHVGRTLAVFVGVEVKTAEGRVRPEQKAFLAALTRAGARCGVARSVEDFATIINPHILR